MSGPERSGSSLLAPTKGRRVHQADNVMHSASAPSLMGSVQRPCLPRSVRGAVPGTSDYLSSGGLMCRKEPSRATS
jgi:hypothetical protein